jgi:predicted N-acyltransferase
MRTCFVGSTVAEYAPLPRGGDPTSLVRALATGAMRDEVRSHALTIVKDLPVDSPLLDRASNVHAAAVSAALSDAGFALLAGQALAFVPVQFASIDQYLARFCAARCKDIRRKLRSRRDLQIDALGHGPGVSRTCGSGPASIACTATCTTAARCSSIA